MATSTTSAVTQQTQTVEEVIAAALVTQGVGQFFGLMGDDTALLTNTVIKRGLTYYDARHENGAVSMAAGFASATSGLGVCFVSRGPGLTNALTALVNAASENVALLVITGGDVAEPPVNTVELPDYKTFDLAGLGAVCGIPVFAPQSTDAVELALRDACASALRGRTIIFSIAREFRGQPVSPHSQPAAQAPAESRSPARPMAVQAAAAVLAQSRRPLIVAGRGAWRAGAGSVIAELVEHLGALVATSLGAKDMFHGHPYDVGLVGSFSHAPGRRLMEQADCILAFGASLNRFSTVSGTALPEVPLIQVDAERANIGRYHWADVALVGDARAVAGQLLASLPVRAPADKPQHTDEVRSALAGYEPASEFEAASTRWAVDPRALVVELDKVLPKDRLIVSDTGNFFGLLPPYLSVPSPDRFRLSSVSMLSLSPGWALGASVGHPGVCPVLFIGDGGLLMSLGELETMARLQLPLIVVVMNDHAYGAELHYMRLSGLSGSEAVYPDTDFAPIAEVFGIESATIRSVEDLATLAPKLVDRDSPLLLDCKVVSVVAPFLSGG